VDIGIGLPNAVVGVTAPELTEWAGRAEDAGFSCLASIDRLRYPSFESLVTLAAVATTTSRIRLTTAIVVGPLRETTLLAKQLATLDQLSGGRLTVGIAVGEMSADFEACGVPMRGRGTRLEKQLAELADIWRTGAVGPATTRPGGPTVVLGGHAPAALKRVVRHADGWMGGGTSTAVFRGLSKSITAAWRKQGRSGKPHVSACVFYALGERGPDAVAGYFRDYYGFPGGYDQLVGRGVAASPGEVRTLVEQFDKAGCDELIFMPCASDPVQVNLLTDAVHKVASLNAS
jgi:alkanesulfonate monooxygenase SsuD/methylene tetrahydromethanopterin reductase-like flavin-dependent oxidoreductase (luciferase family)